MPTIYKGDFNQLRAQCKPGLDEMFLLCRNYMLQLLHLVLIFLTLIMNTLLLFFILLLSLLSTAQSGYRYPLAPPSHEQETRFGYTYTNPYKDLVDINSVSTKAWLAAEQKMMMQYEKNNYGRINMFENAISSNAWDISENRLPTKKRDMYLAIGYNPDGQPIVYYKTDIDHNYGQLCPTNIFERGKDDKLYVSGLELSADKKHIALLISHGGSDWMELKIRDIEAKRFLPDTISWIKFNGIVWSKEGFYYVRFDPPATNRELIDAGSNQRLMYHKLGTPVHNDKVILTSDSEYTGDIELAGFDEENVAIVHYSRMEKNRRVTVVAYFKPDSLENGLKEFIVTPYNAFSPFRIIGMQGGSFLTLSTFKAPNGQLILYNPHKVNDGRVIIEQFAQPMRYANNLKDKIFCVYYDMGKFLPIVFDTTGKVLKKIDVPDGFSVSGFNYTINDSVTLYTLSSFETFSRTLKFDFKNLKTIVYDETTANIFRTGYTSKIVKYYSKDSTEIPMYIVHSKNIVPDINTPLLIYAYGGFGSSMDPQYNPGFKMFMKSGGILAVPLIRGGGELGVLWHKAGMRLNKQKGVDDFIAATEYFINNKMASPKRIAIHGGSNGGLLVGMAMVQRPDLYRAVVPAAGLFDLANFHQFTSAGFVGIREYGDPNDSLEFHNLIKLSPLHNIKPGVVYPPTLAITGSHDDRVVPSHSYRFIAQLQNNVNNLSFPPAYLLHVKENTGHNTMGFFQHALMYSFIYEELNMKAPN